MKTLLIITTMLLMVVIARGEDSFLIPQRDLSYGKSYETSNPKTQEQVQCFPAQQVQSWKKRKKVAPKEKIVEKVVEKIVEKEVYKEAPKNSLSLMLGRTVTGLEATSASAPTYKVESTGQLDVGLMYQRELGKKWRGSVIGTINGSFYGAIGKSFNFPGE